MKIIDVVIRASFDKRTKWGPEKREVQAFLDNAISHGSIYGLKIQISENRAIAGRSKTMRCRMPSQRYLKLVRFWYHNPNKKYSTRETSLEGTSIISEM